MTHKPRRLVHTEVLAIRWGDMDAMGHVNNTVYFRYFEVSRIDWLQSIGGAPDPSGQGPVIVNTFCNFLRPLEYPGQLLARHYVANPGRTSFDAFITLERTDQPGVVYASGGATTVWFDSRTQKAVPLPAWLREHLG